MALLFALVSLFFGAAIIGYVRYRKLVKNSQALEGLLSIRVYPDDSSDYFLDNKKAPLWVVPFVWFDICCITGVEVVRDYRNGRGEVIPPTKEWDEAFRTFYAMYRAARYEYGGRLRRARNVLEECAPFSWMEVHYVSSSSRAGEQ